MTKKTWNWRRRLDDWGAQAPLIAALLAPFSGLLYIPACSQRWFFYYGVTVPDPTASLALCAVNLGLNLVANVLLAIRFSPVNRRWWGPGTIASAILWSINTIIAVVNLSLFGKNYRTGPGYSYTEGFWCEVAAAVFSGIISILLVLNHILFCNKGFTEKVSTRVQGRHLMLSVSFLMIIIGIQALVYSKIQGWYYFDGIYFTVETMLTIGFGDFVPTHTSTRLLILPFSLLTMSQIGYQVSKLIQFFHRRAQVRRQNWKRRYERGFRALNVEKNPHMSLEDEVELLECLYHREELVAEIWGLALSLTLLIIFWMVGASIFSNIQPGWTFGDALYFQVVFCLTIGYGDFVPTEPGARVFWVVYALLGVPIIASVAVQAATGLVTTYYQHRLEEARKKHAKDIFSSAFTEHKEFVLHHRRTLISQGKEQAEPLATQSQTLLMSEVIDAAVRLEALSRRLLTDALPVASLGRRILVADRDIQLREASAARGDSVPVTDLWQEGDDSTNDDLDGQHSLMYLPLDDPHTLHRIRKYRDLFAYLLAAASMLQKLEGDEQQQFERWLALKEEGQCSGTSHHEHDCC